MTEKRPFVVTIEEKLERTVVVWAEDKDDAYEKTEDLCNEGVIDLDCECFVGREFSVSKFDPNERDLSLYCQFGKEN